MTDGFGQLPVKSSVEFHPKTLDLALVLVVAAVLLLTSALLHPFLVVRWGLLDSEAAFARTALLLFFIGFFSLGLVLGIYVIVVRRRRITWQTLGLRPVSLRWFGRAFAAAILSVGFVVAINITLYLLSGQVLRNPQISAAAPMGSSWFGYIGMLILGGVFAPFAEELLFRGLVYPWIRYYLGVRTAVVLSALAFAAVHGILWLVPSFFVVGVVLALVYQRSNSLWPAIVTHGAFNATMLTLLYVSLAAG